MSNYNASIRKSGYWFGDGAYKGSRIKPNNGIIHTTEGTSLPSYGGGSSAPHYTAIPNFRTKTLTWVAHFPDEQSARALRNESGGVETNTLNCIQIELVGTCDPGTSKRWGSTPHIFWPNAPEWALREVAKFVADMNKRHKIPVRGPGKPWVAYPASYGIKASQRMSFAQWRNHTGWAGHQHVPENSHGDPGNLRWDLIEKYTKELLNPVTRPESYTRTEIRSMIGRVIRAIDVTLEGKKPTANPRVRAARAALVVARRALK